MEEGGNKAPPREGARSLGHDGAKINFHISDCVDHGIALRRHERRARAEIPTRVPLKVPPHGASVLLSLRFSHHHTRTEYRKHLSTLKNVKSKIDKSKGPFSARVLGKRFLNAGETPASLSGNSIDNTFHPNEQNSGSRRKQKHGRSER